MRTHNKSSQGAVRMDMLHGSLLNKILLFSLPLAASSILQQLFNSVDVAVVGRFASDQALAAVGSNSSVISLMINLFVGISVGANVVIIQASFFWLSDGEVPIDVRRPYPIDRKLFHPKGIAILTGQ